MAGLFDDENFSSNMLGLGGMLLAAGAPTTDPGYSRRTLGAGLQQFAQQQKQAGMNALKQQHMKGQISAQELAAKLAEEEIKEKQRDASIYENYLASQRGPQGPVSPEMMGPRAGNDSATSLPQQTAAPSLLAQQPPGLLSAGQIPGYPAQRAPLSPVLLGASPKLAKYAELQAKQDALQRQRALDLKPDKRGAYAAQVWISPSGHTKTVDQNTQQDELDQMAKAGWLPAPTRQEVGRPNEFGVQGRMDLAGDENFVVMEQIYDRVSGLVTSDGFVGGWAGALASSADSIRAQAEAVARGSGNDEEMKMLSKDWTKTFPGLEKIAITNRRVYGSLIYMTYLAAKSASAGDRITNEDFEFNGKRVGLGEGNPEVIMAQMKDVMADARTKVNLSRSRRKLPLFPSRTGGASNTPAGGTGYVPGSLRRGN